MLVYVLVMWQLLLGQALMFDTPPVNAFAGPRAVMNLQWWGALFSVAGLTVGLLSFHRRAPRTQSIGWLLSLAVTFSWAASWWYPVIQGGLTDLTAGFLAATAPLTYLTMFLVTVIAATDVRAVRRTAAKEADHESATA